jgi:hypothetical protein
MSNSSNHRSRLQDASGSLDPHSLREALAALEHDQWCEWSRAVAEGESLSAERTARWSRRWVAYSDLSDADKDLDREYADRVIRLLARFGVVPSEQDEGPQSG